MNLSRSLVAILVLSLSGVVACASSTDDEASSSTSAAETSCSAMTKYNQAIAAAQTTLQTSYDAAMTQFNADVKQAEADRDAKLASLPKGDGTADLYNQVITDYNAEVGPNGPIVAKYNASVKTAQDVFNKTVQAALAAYDAHPCAG